MPAGYSSRGGQVVNPYEAALSPGGSSSGSAVAVTADLCTVAVGTETSGSILSPANQNSVVGIKPTVGLVSRSGIVPIAASQDTAGPLARTVADAAALLGVLAGADPGDRATRASRVHARPDYTASLDPRGLDLRGRPGGMRNHVQRSRVAEPPGAVRDVPRVHDERRGAVEDLPGEREVLGPGLPERRHAALEHAVCEQAPREPGIALHGVEVGGPVLAADRQARD